MITHKYSTLKAGLALTVVGSAAQGALVNLGPFPSGTSIDVSDGNGEFLVGGYIYATTSSVVSSSGYFRGIAAGNFAGSAYRAAGTVTVSIGGVAGNNILTSFGSGFRGAQPGSDNYVAIQFVDANVNNGNPVVGFAQVNFATDATSVLNFWYSNSGDPVQLMNGEVTQAPEPSSLGLLALGAAGMLSRRRRSAKDS